MAADMIMARTHLSRVNATRKLLVTRLGQNAFDGTTNTLSPSPRTREHG